MANEKKKLGIIIPVIIFLGGFLIAWGTWITDCVYCLRAEEKGSIEYRKNIQEKIINVEENIEEVKKELKEIKEKDEKHREKMYDILRDINKNIKSNSK